MSVGVPAVADQGIDPTTKQHRLVERSFHPLLDEGSSQGPPAVQITHDGRLFAYVSPTSVESTPDDPS